MGGIRLILGLEHGDGIACFRRCFPALAIPGLKLLRNIPQPTLLNLKDHCYLTAASQLGSSQHGHAADLAGEITVAPAQLHWELSALVPHLLYLFILLHAVALL